MWKNAHKFIAFALAASWMVLGCDSEDTAENGGLDSGVTDDAGADTETGTGTDTGTDVDTETGTDTGYLNTGLCGFVGEAVVQIGAYSGTQEYFLESSDRRGEDICRVRVDVTYAGEAPEPDKCPDCYWTCTAELSNPQVVINENDVCGSSELGLDAAAIAELDGKRVAYGYALEKSGHMDILLRYDEAEKKWIGLTQSTKWKEETGELTYKKTSWCGY